MTVRPPGIRDRTPGSRRESRGQWCGLAWAERFVSLDDDDLSVLGFVHVQPEMATGDRPLDGNRRATGPANVLCPGAFAPAVLTLGMAGASPTDVEECDLNTARRQLGGYAVPVDRTDRIPLSVAVGRVLATDATANDPVAGSVAADETVFERGHHLRPADVGLLKAAGVSELLVRQRPQVGIVPTGDGLVEYDPGPEERVETAGFTLAQYVDRWGGKVTYRGAVADDAPALRMAVQRDLTRDIVVVTGTEPGDTLRAVVRELGDIIADRVAITPGGETGLAVVQNRPVLLLPESPVDARVSAVQLLRPLLKAFADAPLGAHPSQTAALTEDVVTDEAVRAFVPVALDDDQDTATPLSGTDIATATRADGWVTVPAKQADPVRGEQVAVENWDYLP